MQVRFALRETRQAVLVHPKASAVSMTVDGVPVYVFDLEGRLLSVYDGARTWIRGLDDHVLEKRATVTPAGRQKFRRPVPEDDKREALRGRSRPCAGSTSR